MATLQERFDAKVDRTGGHHLWTGSTDASGVPQIRVDGRLTTARRVAWEFAHGPLSPAQRITACPASTRRVRVEHLAIAGRAVPPAAEPATDAASTKAGTRRKRGTGSVVEQSPGVWRVAASGSVGRTVRIVHGTHRDAEAVLATLLVPAGPALPRTGDLITGYLSHPTSSGHSSGTVRRYEQLWLVHVCACVSGRAGPARPVMN